MGEVNIDERVANNALAVDDESRGYGNEPGLIAMPLGKIYPQIGQNLAIGGRHAKQNAAHQAYSAIHIGQDFVTQVVIPLGLGEMVARVWRQRCQLTAKGLNVRQSRLHRL